MGCTNSTKTLENTNNKENIAENQIKAPEDSSSSDSDNNKKGKKNSKQYILYIYPYL